MSSDYQRHLNYILPLNALLFLNHFSESQCLFWTWMAAPGCLGHSVCGRCAGTPVWWCVSLCVCCALLFCWTSHLGIPRIWMGGWWASLSVISLFVLFQKHLYFCCFGFFIRLDMKESCLDSLCHHSQRSGEGTYSNLPYCYYLFWKLICTPLFLVSHALGWCPEENLSVDVVGVGGWLVGHCSVDVEFHLKMPQMGLPVWDRLNDSLNVFDPF